MGYNKEKLIERMRADIEAHPEIMPDVLTLAVESLEAYRERVKKESDGLLTEALGDAVHLLAMKRRPNDVDMGPYVQRIVKARFSEGLPENYHEGEKMFYDRYVKEV